MNYVSSDVIVNDVKNRMQSYFSSGKVDESILPRVIRKCVGQMGLRVYPEKRAVLEICNFKAKLPDDFRRVCLAMLCSGSTTYVKTPFRSRLDQVVCEVPCASVCSTTCQHSALTDDCGNVLKIIETTEYDAMESSEFTVLKASQSSKPWCAEGCLNFGAPSTHEFEVKQTANGPVIHTNVCDGKLYLEYLSDLEHEDHFEIPDNEAVKDWIFEELRREIYTYLWDNGEDVMQRMQHSQSQLYIKEERARQVYSQRSVQERYDTTNRLMRRYKSMESWMSPRGAVYSRR